MDLQGLISLSEAARVCRVDARTLRRWIEEDGIPLRRLPVGHAIHWKELHKCLVRRGLPVPEDLRAGPRILLVDDEPDMLLMMVDSFEGLWDKASIGTAQDGRRGLQKLTDMRPDLLVTDLEMPNMSGVELCRWVRQDRELAATKILAVTGRHGAQYSRAVLDSGADEYLIKPFFPAELRRAAVRLLGIQPFVPLVAGHAGPKEERL